ncbi:hypothetical protein L6164_020693 [Bauhinia variegata]|uniref:Uncharacterized protein n=1 Tax=Bauhinia variegata TaxID=167791 RepID=A0ACB9MVU1_BAUVA|nr:hypothetical protein L6164_020693 [Bauhinia variegata]
MNSANQQLFLPLLCFFLAIAVLSEVPLHAFGQQSDWGSQGTGFGRRVLLGFKEKPAGSNVTYECSPSGPCVPCLYSEKSDQKYRCSETGYRIPFKCTEIKDTKKDSKGTNSKNARSFLEVSDSIEKLQNVLHSAQDFTTSVKHRNLLDDSSPSDNKLQAYITYRSCISPVTEERLSVLGFEGIVIVFLVLSGSVIYLRKKKAVAASGFVSVRTQTNSRF